MITEVQQGRRTMILSAPEAQAEVFWLAFRTLPEDTQTIIRHRFLGDLDIPSDLALEPQSWQAAAAEALLSFETPL